VLLVLISEHFEYLEQLAHAATFFIKHTKQ